MLFVGMLSGTYSSICIATPVLADLKERQPEFKQLTKQIAQRATSTKRQARVAVAGAAAKANSGGGSNGGGVAVDDDAPPEDLTAQDVAAEDEVSSAPVISGRVPATSQGRAPTTVRTSAGSRQQPRRTTSAQRKKRK